MLPGETEEAIRLEKVFLFMTNLVQREVASELSAESKEMQGSLRELAEKMKTPNDELAASGFLKAINKEEKNREEEAKEG